MHHRLLAAAALAACLVVTAAPAAVATPGPGWQARMLVAVNAARAQSGAAPLRLCPSLQRAAAKYAAVMATTGSFGHTGPDGRTPGDRVRAEGYSFHASGENVARGFPNVARVMDGWQSSPTHLRTLLNPTYRHVGFGYARGSSGASRHYWVQEFGAGGGCR